MVGYIYFFPATPWNYINIPPYNIIIPYQRCDIDRISRRSREIISILHRGKLVYLPFSMLFLQAQSCKNDYLTTKASYYQWHSERSSEWTRENCKCHPFPGWLFTDITLVELNRSKCHGGIYIYISRQSLEIMRKYTAHFWNEEIKLKCIK
jgi:hypothetical protein